MPRALIVTEGPVAADPIRLGLLAAGCVVIEVIEGGDRLLKRAITLDPDLVVAACGSPTDALLAATRSLELHAPCPVLMFAADCNPAPAAAAVRSGVHGYIVDTASPQRLRAEIEAACARFQVMSELRTAVATAESRLEERKLVDRAKGILMKSRQMSEDEAYSALRRLAMDRKQKLAAIAEQVITAARVLV